MMDDLTLDELKPLLAAELPCHAGFDGWTPLAVERAAEALGVDPLVAGLVFGSPVEMIDAWFAAIDSAMLAALTPGALGEMKIRAKITALVEAGVEQKRLVIDPGIGFGKGVAVNLALMNGLSLFHGLGCPVLVGASRKRLIGALSNEAPADKRLGGSLTLGLKAAEQGAQIIRVHDVPETVQALRVWRGMRDKALSPG